jgi:hypothetical protein
MAKIIIAGGTGLVGSALAKRLIQEKNDVFILTRSPKKLNHIFWDPKNKKIDRNQITNTEILINLCGESVGEGRWTTKRKKELLDSRVDTTNFLFDEFHQQKTLKQYLSASGIDAYPLDQRMKEMKEEDAFGSDFLSQLVKKWEESADIFERIVPVFKLRISMVLAKEGGALQKLIPLVKYRIASPIGKGNQCTTWVHIEDVASAFSHAISNKLDGAFNITGVPVTNRMLMNELMKANGRKMWAPNVPAFIIKAIMGEQATIVLDGANASPAKLKETGFRLSYPNLQNALSDIFKK